MGSTSLQKEEEVEEKTKGVVPGFRDKGTLVRHRPLLSTVALTWKHVRVQVKTCGTGEAPVTHLTGSLWRRGQGERAGGQAGCGASLYGAPTYRADPRSPGLTGLPRGGPNVR